MTTYSKRDYRLVRLSGTVTHVADGDTLDVEAKFGFFGTRKEVLRIRFAGMDTPEIRDQQPFAEEAKQYVIDHVLNKRIDVSGVFNSWVRLFIKSFVIVMNLFCP